MYQTKDNLHPVMLIRRPAATSSLITSYTARISRHSVLCVKKFPYNEFRSNEQVLIPR